MTRHVLYEDRRPRSATAHLDELLATGVQAIAVMVEASRYGWQTRWSPSDLHPYARRCEDAGVRVVPMVWVEPQRAYLRELARRLPRLLDAVGHGEVGLDAEHPQWSSGRLAGYPTMDAAERALVEVCHVAGATVLRGSTYLGSHAARRTGLLEYCDVREVQCYGRRQWDRDPEPESEWGDSKSPTGRPDVVIPRFLERHPQRALAVALPLWSQLYPGHTARKAILGGYRATLAYQPLEVAWWVARHGHLDLVAECVRLGCPG